MDIKPIRNDSELQSAIGEIETLWGALPGTPDGDRLEVLMILADAYESAQLQAHVAVDSIAVLEHIMDANGYRPVDLGRVIGSRSAATDLLKRRRRLSLNHVRAITLAWHIPAGLLVPAYQLKEDAPVA